MLCCDLLWKASAGGSPACWSMRSQKYQATDHSLREQRAGWQALQHACQECMADVNTRPRALRFGLTRNDDRQATVSVGAAIHISSSTANRPAAPRSA